MSIGFIYNIFDGAELLEPSIRSIRNVVDEVVVVYQTKSYYGNVIGEYEIADVIDHLCDMNLIDRVIKMNFSGTASSPAEAKTMEKRKYQAGLDFLNDKKIDYFRNSAADEFFIESEFKKCRDYIIKNKTSRSYCEIATYSDINSRDKEKTDDVNTVFLYKNLGSGFKIGDGGPHNTPVYIDRIGTYGVEGNDHVFSPDLIKMHHYRLLRLDLKLKSSNSSIGNPGDLKKQIADFEKMKEKSEFCKNIFNIDLIKFKELFYRKK